jgi:hypothetical protein
MIHIFCGRGGGEGGLISGRPRKGSGRVCFVTLLHSPIISSLDCTSSILKKFPTKSSSVHKRSARPLLALSQHSMQKYEALEDLKI